MNDFPIVLRDEDRAAPPDPHVVIVELLAQVRAGLDDGLNLRDLLTAWDSDPMVVRRRAQSRSVELAEQLGRLLDTAETLAQSLHAAGLFSARYSDAEVR